MKNLILLFFAICFSTFLVGQSYNTAGGVRVGTEYGLTFKQRIAKKITLEGIIQKGTVRNETAVTLLAEKHFPVLSRRINFYLGAGVHKGWINNENILYDDPVGITGIGGIELTIRRLNFSFDYKPAYNVSGGIDNLYSQTGVSLRYVFVKRKSKTKKFIEDGKWKVWKKNRNKKSSKKKSETNSKKKPWEIWKRDN